MGHHHDNTHLTHAQDQNPAKSEIMRTARIKMEYRLAAERYLAPLLPDASADKLLHCGDYVITQANADRTRERIEIGYYCGQRLCPSCAWRQSVHDAQRLAAISAAAADRHNLRMILVTLTVPNVGADDLRDTLRNLNKWYNKLRRRAKMAILLSNTAKKLEITYNRKMETYHPHLHIICYVPSTYWARSNYVSHDTLLHEWRAATGMQQITQVDIRVCRSTDTSDAIREVAKYAAKAADYSTSAEVMSTMYHALYGAQRLSLAGIARDLSRAYDRHELDQYIVRDDTQYTLRVVYQWLAGDYTEIGSSQIDQQAEQLAHDGWHELVPADWGVLMGAD